MSKRDPVTNQFVTTFDQDTWDEIIRRVESGEFTAPILREYGLRQSTFYQWMHADPARLARYEEAKDTGEQMFALSVLEIADDGTNDYVMGKNGPMLDSENISRSKLRAEIRLKLLGKFNPKRWGERQAVEHSGAVAVLSHEEWLAQLDEPKE